MCNEAQTIMQFSHNMFGIHFNEKKDKVMFENLPMRLAYINVSCKKTKKALLSFPVMYKM